MSNVIVQHPPAVKVGGRRLSLSSRPKPHSLAGVSEPETVKPDEAPEDYPRPAPPGEDSPRQHTSHHDEESPPKREKKHDSHDNEKKLKELPHWKTESTRPTREAQVLHKGTPMGRIAQPAGKAFGV